MLFSSRKWVALLCLAVLLIGGPSHDKRVAAQTTLHQEKAEFHLSVETAKENGYERYLDEHEAAAYPDRVITMEAEHYVSASDMTPRLTTGQDGHAASAVLTEESGSITWEFDVPESGLYHMGIRYLNVPGKNSDIERELAIDGEVPFVEASHLFFQRTWKNESKTIERDSRNNDLRPTQIEQEGWRDEVIRDVTGYFEEPYYFYFSEGHHTLTLTSLREPMAIDAIWLFQAAQPMNYEDQLKIYEQLGYKKASEQAFIKVQAEDAVLKSSPTLYPMMDRSPRMEPYHVSKVRMNAIGGYNWRMPGQWIEWEVDVPEDALYQIAFKSKQSHARGLTSTRRLYIDGTVPFREAERLSFDYSADWRNTVLGEAEIGEPYLFFLSKGKHRIRLEVTLGELSPVIRAVEASILELNELYRKILSFTGTVPDPFRDYQLEQRIPELQDILRKQSAIIQEVASFMEGLEGKTSDRTALLHTLIYQMEDMADKPETVPTRLENFKTNVGALGTWMYMVKEQSLTLDYLIVSSEGAELPRAKPSFWEKLIHEIRTFFASFFEDYDSIGHVESADRVVTVWVLTGRDQAQSLKKMIDNDFTQATGIDIKLQLVPADVLLSATLAGRGPDVAIQVGNDVPVNFAMRSALADLSQFDDYEQVADRFHPSALVPYAYNGGVFALPEQQIFPLLFYRKDILEELELDVPETWDDVYRMIPVLQKNNLQFGLPFYTVDSAGTGVTDQLPPNPTYAMLLYQNDGELYRDEGLASALDTEPSIQAFKKWTELFANYKLPIQFDFPNRFRTGEMPIGIAEYTTYNHLSVSAPEIRGLWDFAPIPGTETAGGEIRRDAASRGFGAIMFKDAKNKHDAWQFMKWWTDKKAQVDFGREMEGLMGPAGRYPTANLQALAELPWPSKDLGTLMEQWEWLRGNPEVPGGYFTGRHLDNAFRRVVLQGDDAREAIDHYVRFINEEITIKRKEFQLPLSE